jgi:hypothetical protein
LKAEKQLRNDLIKLAKAHPGQVREALLPILKQAGQTDFLDKIFSPVKNEVKDYLTFLRDFGDSMNNLNPWEWDGVLSGGWEVDKVKVVSTDDAEVEISYRNGNDAYFGLVYPDKLEVTYTSPISLRDFPNNLLSPAADIRHGVTNPRSFGKAMKEVLNDRSRLKHLEKAIRDGAKRGFKQCPWQKMFNEDRVFYEDITEKIDRPPGGNFCTEILYKSAKTLNVTTKVSGGILHLTGKVLIGFEIDYESAKNGVEHGNYDFDDY